jgi:hypothetical protein
MRPATHIDPFKIELSGYRTKLLGGIAENAIMA